MDAEPGGGSSTPPGGPRDWLDANVILRFLLDDHPDHSPRAAALIRRAEAGDLVLAVPLHILCEVLFVLEGQGYGRQDISDGLARFCLVKGVEVEARELVLAALLLYKEHSADFADMLLHLLAETSGGAVWTFNRKCFQRIGQSWKEP
jgi:predicted nucleic acid-binding protein